MVFRQKFINYKKGQNSDEEKSAGTSQPAPGEGLSPRNWGLGAAPPIHLNNYLNND